MKALTLHRPWSWAVCHAGKDVENRSWVPPLFLDGLDFAIHSARTYDVDGGVWISATFGLKVPLAPPESCVVAVARLGGVLLPDAAGPKSPWHVAGQHGWLLDDVRVLAEPVPCRGAQGLWTLPPDVEERVLAQIGGGRG